MKKIRRYLTVCILVLAMVCMMLPMPVSAASNVISQRDITSNTLKGVTSNPKISPSGTKYVYAGTSITIKASGTYKKVAYKSSNTKAATVNKKGVVTAKKAGTANITATFTLKNKKKVEKTCTIKVLSSNIVKVTEVNDASAQEVVKALESGRAFDILVKGSKESSAELIESLKKKIGYVNEYSVLFSYNDITSCNEGYLFHVTKDNCEMYNLSLSFFKKIVAQTIRRTFGTLDDDDGTIICTQEERLAYARSFPTWQAYAAAAENNYPMAPDSEEAAARRNWLLANYKFCDLSQAVQVWIVSSSGYFSGNGAFGHQFGLMGIVYGTDGDNLWGRSALQQMRHMEADKAQGACGGIAKAEVTALTQIGIECLYESDGGHAWTMVYPYNADGQKLTYEFDYALKGLEDASPGADPNIKTQSNRLAICSYKSLIY